MKKMSFDEFKRSVEAQVTQVATQMSSLYKRRCTSQFTQCSTKSYNQCKGTDYYQCLNAYPKKSWCLNQGISVSKSSGVRLPNSFSYDQLLNEDKLAVCASAKLDTTFKNARLQLTDKVGRIYVGTSSGMFRGYPGTHQNNTDGVCTKDYDPRFRPWYVSATSGSKNLILIIDVSGSMNGTPLEIAKTAAKSVIDTLGLGDFVGVISFSDSASTLRYESIKRATTQTKEGLKLSIDNLVAQGSTNYEASFQKAEQMFKLAKEDQYGSRCLNSVNIVLFMTDGKPTVGATTAEQLISQIDTWNSAYNIKLFSYGLGRDYQQQTLRKLTCKYQGISFQIPDETSSSQLLNAIRSYYLYLSNGLNITQPVWSEPYDDFATGIRMVTASMPIYYTQNSITATLGVAGIDVSMEALKSYGIEQKEVSVKLLKSSPCLQLSLTSCQLEKLRPSSAKCGIQNCDQNSDSINFCSIQVSSSVVSSPPSSNKQSEQCCGLTVGALVGIIIGSILGALLLAIIIYCCWKSKKKQAEKNQQNQNKANDNPIGSGQNLRPDVPYIQQQQPYAQYFAQENGENRI